MDQGNAEEAPTVATAAFSAHKTLVDLAEGAHAVVRGLRAEGRTRRRLLDLGLVPGTRIEVIMRARGGDPTAYGFRGVTVALRREDAELVEL